MFGVSSVQENQKMTNEISKCPWGDIQETQRIADGIYYITTASHGGYLVSGKRWDEMPEHFRKCSLTDDNWFEHDMSWCGVVLAYPDCFPPALYHIAKQLYREVYETLKSTETRNRNNRRTQMNTAIISISFPNDLDIDPCDAADCIVRQLIDLGFPATLEDVETTTTGEHE